MFVVKSIVIQIIAQVCGSINIHVGQTINDVALMYFFLHKILWNTQFQADSFEQRTKM